MYARLVWDGKEFQIPEELGKPREDQFQGSNLDNLVELSGRICYRSIGKGRNSEKYHQHIIDVQHGSVWEHANLTFLIPNMPIPDYLPAVESLINRPGVHIEKVAKQILTNNGMLFDLKITANLRSIREWHNYPAMSKWATVLGQKIRFLTKKEAPLVLSDVEDTDNPVPMKIVEPDFEEEIWLSFFITNISRAVSHEWVRHKYRTSVSQVSTRYVQENNSKWCLHPLFLKYLSTDEEICGDLNFTAKDLIRFCQNGYSGTVEKLEDKLIKDGIDPFTARKQARGAARGFLGNALMTEMIFSASLAQWKRMFLMRCSPAADAEIRVAMNEVYDIVSAKYPDKFQNWEKVDCPDKIGFGVIKK